MYSKCNIFSENSFASEIFKIISNYNESKKNVYELINTDF